MKEIRSEIIIHSSISKVWRIFTDFNSYPEWNPFIASLTGSVAVGNIINIMLTPPDAKPMKFSPRISKYTENSELRWLGHLFIPGLFDGEHIFELKDNNDGTVLFIQREIFNGILVNMFKKMLDDNTKRGFESMNNKLKEKSE